MTNFLFSILQLALQTLEFGVLIGESNHSSLSVTIGYPLYKCLLDPFNESLIVFDWPSADWQRYAIFCDIDWLSSFVKCKNSDECWQSVKNFMYGGKKLFVPQYIKKGATLQFKNKKSLSRFISNLDIKKTNLWRLSRINPSVLNK